MNVDKLIEKAQGAVKKRNYDYAISIFLEAVNFAPNNRVAREGLRAAELRKYEAGYPSKLAILFGTLGNKLGILLARLGKKGNPEGYMMACEKYLVKDPKSLKVNMALGDAAAMAGHLEAAIVAYNNAAEHHSEDITALKHLGALLWKRGDIREAAGFSLRECTKADGRYGNPYHRPGVTPAARVRIIVAEWAPPTPLK
ncbi:MAG: tetratricopeptide repeat protein, partial [Planctomycetota bacterium]